MNWLSRYLFRRRARSHRRWLKRNKVLLAPDPRCKRNSTEAVP